MDSNQLDQADKSSPETFSSSCHSRDSNDRFGESLVHPRFGDEYQVDIPSIQNKLELLMDSSYSFLIGLPLPVMWICNKANLIKGSVEALNNPHTVYTNGLTEPGNNVGMNNNISLAKESNVNVDAPNQTYCLVPGQSSAPWSDFEADCFLLGLYIFGKNFHQVTRFMESKGVGEILAFYYGRFYGSIAYRRWSECRKKRNRKCVLGHRFFTGYRQRELFAQLSPNLSEESKTRFLEVSRAFVERRKSLEEYVSSFKTLVGIHALVKAVGIGKGKGDPTALILDGAKNSQLFTHRPEIPSGKTCSSLTCAEIVKFLTGDFRLSIAQSNDLFWEAVWPRLLARGWHSEQPRGDTYAGSKNCLVFLIPGIKKFSRGKLSKGDHYFDSVSDVLAKVANEPALLELEADETTRGISKVENRWGIDVKSDDDRDLSDHERHCYLKPRVSTKISNLFKFTVVDTSLTNEDNTSKVRELRNLPLVGKSCSFGKTDRLEAHADTMQNGLRSSTTLSHSGVMNADGASKRVPDSHNLVLLEKPGEAKLIIKHKFNRHKLCLTSCSSGQVMKIRRPTSCVKAELTYVLSLPAITYKPKNKSKNGAASKAMMTEDAVPSRANQCDDAKVISTKTLVEGTSDEKILQDKSLTNFSSGISREKEILAQELKVIDLNLPPVEPESDEWIKLEVEPESDGKVKLEVEIESDDKVKLEGAKNSFVQLAESKKPEHDDTKDQLLSCVNLEPTNKGGDALNQQQPRRKSIRNRPLTTKALEAIEIGFLNLVSNSRKRSPSTFQEQKSKRSSQPCIKSSIVDFEVREAADENCNGKLPETLGNAISVEKAPITYDVLGLPKTSFAPTGSSN